MTSPAHCNNTYSNQQQQYTPENRQRNHTHVYVMGLLKHFLFPVLALVNGMMMISIHVMDDKIGVANIWLQGTPDAERYNKEDSQLTTLESHAVSAVGAFNAAFAFGFIVGIVREDSHFRGIMLCMQTINYIFDSIDAYQRGLNAMPLYVLTVLCMIGLAVHRSEPGIFTKDKNKMS